MFKYFTHCRILTHTEFIAEEASCFQRIFPYRSNFSVKIKTILTSEQRFGWFSLNLFLQTVHFVCGQIRGVADDNIKIAVFVSVTGYKRICLYSSNSRVIQFDIFFKVFKSFIRIFHSVNGGIKQFLIQRYRNAAASAAQIEYFRSFYLIFFHCIQNIFNQGLSIGTRYEPSQRNPISSYIL